MAVAAGILWLSLGVTWLLVHARLPHTSDKIRGLLDNRRALDAMLATEQCSRSSIMVVTDDSPWAFTMMQDLKDLQAPWGVGVFGVTNKEQNANTTRENLSQVIVTARRLLDVSWWVTVVVVSEDPTFLSAFAEFSFKNHLLSVHTTRLLAFTRLPVHRLHTLHHLHKTLSRTSALLAVVDDASPVLRQTRVLSWLPFTDPETRPLQVASWTTDQNLSLVYPPNLFPKKFLQFPHRPHVMVTAEELPSQSAVMVDDPTIPGSKRLTFTGAAGHIMEILSTAMNFTYTYLRSLDKSWGLQKSDGTWSGMLGLITREEVEFTPGPILLDFSRSQWMEYSAYFFMGGYHVLAARGRPEADPWGFVLPLSPIVWATLLIALLAVCSVMLLLPFCFPAHTQEPGSVDANIFNCLRVLLQEDIQRTKSRWWWDRVMLGVWMLMILVLTQSYVGNLMSLLAVRYIDQPYQRLDDVLDKSNVEIILVKNTLIIHYLKTATSGPLCELGNLMGTERVAYRLFAELPQSLETIVRDGSHVVFDMDIIYNVVLPRIFSRTGTCDFYLSQSSYLTTPLAMLAQKNSPFMPRLNKLAYSLVESGLYDKWQKFSHHNSSTCKNPPRIITVTSAFSLSNLWGMFVVLGCGFVMAVVMLVMEQMCGWAKWDEQGQVDTQDTHTTITTITSTTTADHAHHWYRRRASREIHTSLLHFKLPNL